MAPGNCVRGVDPDDPVVRGRVGQHVGRLILASEQDQADLPRDRKSSHRPSEGTQRAKIG